MFYTPIKHPRFLTNQSQRRVLPVFQFLQMLCCYTYPQGFKHYYTVTSCTNNYVSETDSGLLLTILKLFLLEAKDLNQF